MKRTQEFCFPSEVSYSVLFSRPGFASAEQQDPRLFAAKRSPAMKIILRIVARSKLIVLLSAHFRDDNWIPIQVAELQ